MKCVDCKTNKASVCTNCAVNLSNKASALERKLVIEEVMSKFESVIKLPKVKQPYAFIKIWRELKNENKQE